MNSQSTNLQPVWLCWFSCLGCLSTYFWAFDDRLAAIFIAIVGVAGITGYCLGGAVILAFLVSIGFALMFVTRLAVAFGPAVSEFFGTVGVYNHIVSAGVGLMTVGFVAMLVVEVVWNRMLGGRAGVQQYNQTVGLTLGAIQGVFLALLVFGGIHSAAPYAPQVAAGNPESVQQFARKSTVSTVNEINRSLHSSSIGPLVAQHNPFRRLPPLRNLRSQRNTSVLAGNVD